LRAQPSVRAEEARRRGKEEELNEYE